MNSSTVLNIVPYHGKCFYIVKGQSLSSICLLSLGNNFHVGQCLYGGDGKTAYGFS
jgi:hypothetical protein